MIGQFLGNIIPVLLREVAKTPDEQKRLFAVQMQQLSTAYLNCDRETFDDLLCKVDGFPDSLKNGISQALWGNREYDRRNQ